MVLPGTMKLDGKLRKELLMNVMSLAPAAKLSTGQEMLVLLWLHHLTMDMELHGVQQNLRQKLRH